MTKEVPPRIHAILARGRSCATVFRRGPSNQVAVIGWDLDTDEFTLGQWLYGRIYEYRCDLSPDGKYLLYFAAKYGRVNPVEARIREPHSLPQGFGFVVQWLRLERRRLVCRFESCLDQ